MKRTDALYQSFVEILREELVPAMGCTEPIAIAYAAAQARAVLGKRPERVRIEVSGNIIKNVKSVVVPHTGSMHGIAAAAAAGTTITMMITQRARCFFMFLLRLLLRGCAQSLLRKL